jgi:hypothetical protein
MNQRSGCNPMFTTLRALTLAVIGTFPVLIGLVIVLIELSRHGLSPHGYMMPSELWVVALMILVLMVGGTLRAAWQIAAGAKRQLHQRTYPSLVSEDEFPDIDIEDEIPKREQR